MQTNSGFKNFRERIQKLSTDNWSLRFFQFHSWCFQHELGCWQIELWCISVLFSMEYSSEFYPSWYYQYKCWFLQHLLGYITSPKPYNSSRHKFVKHISSTLMNHQEPYHASSLCQFFLLAITHTFLYFSFLFCCVGNFI